MQNNQFNLKNVFGKSILLPTIILAIIILGIIFIPMFSSYDYMRPDFAHILEAPSIQHLFGTDDLGRDLLVRTFVAGRVSFKIAIAASLMIMLIGVLYGAISALSGGVIDMLMMRIVEVLYGIPFLFFSILLLSLFGNSMLLSFIAIASISWLDIARIIRGQTLHLKQKEFIIAAYLMGLNNFQVIIKHIIFNRLKFRSIINKLIVYIYFVDSNMNFFYGDLSWRVGRLFSLLFCWVNADI